MIYAKKVFFPMLPGYIQLGVHPEAYGYTVDVIRLCKSIELSVDSFANL
jgi:hypothetical protein